MITDHAHQVERTRGDRGFVLPGCRICGERLRRHLSWGEAVAARLGGAAEDYVETDSRQQGVM